MAGIGRKNPNAGRKPGIPNKFTRTAREAFELAFDTLGGPAALAKWAKENQTEFYRLYSRLIPVAVSHSGHIGITLTEEQVRKMPQEKLDRILAGEPVEAVLADVRN